jgi:hypothetical protein
VTASAQVVYVGTALDPLPSIAGPCPECGGRLVALLEAPSADDLALAQELLDERQLAHYLGICEVQCGCGWRGSACRPAEARSSLRPVPEEEQ